MTIIIGTIRRRCKGEDDWEEFVECFRVQFKELIEEVNYSVIIAYN